MKKDSNLSQKLRAAPEGSGTDSLKIVLGIGAVCSFCCDLAGLEIRR